MNMMVRTSNFPVIRSYADALWVWREGADTRWSRKPESHASPNGERPLANHRKGYAGIYKHSGTGDIDLRYHDTVIVTWHKDDTCTVDLSYASRSTQALVNHFIPSGVTFALDCGYMWGGQALMTLAPGIEKANWGYHAKTLTYRVDDIVSIKRTEDPVPGVMTRPAGSSYYGPRTMAEYVGDLTKLRPFERRVLDRKLTRALLAETRYADLKLWLDAKCALTGGTSWNNWGKWLDATPGDIRDIVSRGDWSGLTRIADTKSGVLRMVREAIYDGHLVVNRDYVPVADSPEMAKKWLREEYKKWLREEYR